MSELGKHQNTATQTWLEVADKKMQISNLIQLSDKQTQNSHWSDSEVEEEQVDKRDQEA